MRTITIEASALVADPLGAPLAVRSLLTALAAESHSDASDSEQVIRFVRFDRASRSLVRIDSESFSDLTGADKAGTAVVSVPDFGPADVFIDTAGVARWSAKRAGLYDSLRARGAKVFALVDDLCSLEPPDLVDDASVVAAKRFVIALANRCDLLLFFSAAIARTYARALEEMDEVSDVPTLVLGVGAARLPSTEGGSAATVELPDLPGDFLLLLSPSSDLTEFSVAATAMKRIVRARPGMRIVAVAPPGVPSAQRLDAAPGTPDITWVEQPSDEVLSLLHARATLALCLGSAAADGSVLVRSLAAGTVTIASDLDACYEAAAGFADYVHFGAADEVAETALAYLSAPNLFASRRRQIREDFAPPGWDTVARNLLLVVRNLDRVNDIRALPRPDLVQWVFISNQPESLRRTIALLDQNVDWVREYLIVSPPDCLDACAGIDSRHPVVVVNEAELLGERAAEFEATDHVGRNWLLRSALVTLEALDDEFVMLDDDNRPLRDIPLDIFLTADRRYIGYYFYDLTRWPHRLTDYDYGMQGTRAVLAASAMELLAYSSHQPQLINKQLFAEAIEFAATATASVEEWSIYFNYLATRYPTLLSKRVYLTLGWPVGPWAWQPERTPSSYYFENYYPDDEHHAGRARFADDASAAEKQAWLEREYEPYEASAGLYAESRRELTGLELVHGAMVFPRRGRALIVGGVPHLIAAGENAPTRLRLSFVRLGETAPAVAAGSETQFCYHIVGTEMSHGVAVEGRAVPGGWVPHGVLEMDFPAQYLRPGVYEIEFFAKIEGKDVRIAGVRYLSRLVVVGDGDSVREVYAAL